MRKAILLSVKPKHLVNILNGKKIIELRKTSPDCGYPIDVYLYCSKGKDKLFYNRNKGWFISNELDCIFVDGEKKLPYNGKVVGVFELHNIDEYGCEFHEEPLFDKDTCYQSIRLVDRDYDFPEEDELIEYIEVYINHPKGLNEFHKIGYGQSLIETQDYVDDEVGVSCYPGDEPSSQLQSWIDKQFEEVEKEYQITKAPQSWQYVEVEDEE